ncbi:MAG TPA: aminopeptidase [Pseudomonadales bacterium]|nr:aminopeptidase [Pseudomonadales bacterium]
MLRVGLILSLLVTVAACETIGYYGQAALGQGRLLLARRSVEAVIADPATAEAVRRPLVASREMLRFAADELGLPVEERYRDYVALDGDAVVWNLFAAPRFDVTLLQWCFPIAGCVSYRGYFDEGAARRKAAQLAAEGFDVHVGPVAAYSTLGWFDDPMLSTFIGREPADLAELLFHELAHGVVYVPSATAFNESFASFVAAEGVRRWLRAQDDGTAIERWTARAERRRAFVGAALAARERLAAGYRQARADGLDDAAMEAVRTALWAEIRTTWLAERDPGLAPWDPFFLAAPSNARLGTVADYNAHVPEFAALLDDCGGRLDCFLERVRALAEGPASAREAFLAADPAGVQTSR